MKIPKRFRWEYIEHGRSWYISYRSTRLAEIKLACNEDGHFYQIHLHNPYRLIVGTWFDLGMAKSRAERLLQDREAKQVTPDTDGVK